MATISVTRSDMPCRLLDVLRAVEPRTTNLNWYCMELDAGFSCDRSSEQVWAQPWIGDVSDELERQQAGIAMAWQRIKSLASRLRPEDKALFIATRPGIAPPRWPLNVGSPRFEMAIQSGDDQSWYITTRNEGVISLLHEQFKALQIV